MGKYLIPLDGIEYHSSKKIHCKNCLTKEHKEGEIPIHHQAVNSCYWLSNLNPGYIIDWLDLIKH